MILFFLPWNVDQDQRPVSHFAWHSPHDNFCAISLSWNILWNNFLIWVFEFMEWCLWNSRWCKNIIAFQCRSRRQELYTISKRAGRLRVWLSDYFGLETLILWPSRCDRSTAFFTSSVCFSPAIWDFKAVLPMLAMSIILTHKRHSAWNLLSPLADISNRNTLLVLAMCFVT